jgi:hypothetical protein
VNPPEGEKSPDERKGRAQNLAEVESILDEIENLVSNKPRESEGTAKPTPVFEDSQEEGLEKEAVRGDSDLDLGRLEEELHSAIATELESGSDEKTSGRKEIDSEQAIPEDEITRLAEVFEEAEAAKARTKRSSRTGNPPAMETDDGNEDDPAHEY